MATLTVRQASCTDLGRGHVQTHSEQTTTTAHQEDDRPDNKACNIAKSTALAAICCRPLGSSKPPRYRSVKAHLVKSKRTPTVLTPVKDKHRELKGMACRRTALSWKNVLKHIWSEPKAATNVFFQPTVLSQIHLLGMPL